jgi:hypothetical protein
MNYILVGKHGRPSLRAVSAMMHFTHTVLMRKKYRRTGNIQWFVLSNNKWVKHLGLNVNPTFGEQDTIIRWGYSGPINGTPYVYQEGRAIDTISNKARTRLVLAENGVPVPETRVNAPMDSYPFIVRPIRHSRGRDFHVINDVDEYLNGEFSGGTFGYTDIAYDHYSSEIYPKKEEIRVYVAHGKVLMIKDKNYNPEQGIAGNRAVTHNAWTVVPVEQYKRYKTACQIACDAVRAVGGHTGGVDVMINRDHPTMKFCVCEINSAPTICSSEYGVQRYAKYFDWLFRSRRRWWDYVYNGESRQHPERGASYFFTNEQLEK